MTDLDRRTFIAETLRAMGRLGLGLGIGAGLPVGLSGSAGLFCGCDRKPGESEKRTGVSGRSGEPRGRGRRQKRRRGTRPSLPKPLRGKQARWKKAQADEAVARIRVAGVLKPNERGQWAVYDGSGKQLHVAQQNFELSPEFDLQELAYPVCGYAAIRAGHLGPYQRVMCDGDASLPTGHGRIHIAEALAKGCPTFFERVAARITYEEYRIGARLLGLAGRVPERPAGFMERIRLYAHGVGLKVTLPDLGSLGHGLARWDPGDEARLSVQDGLVRCVRRGVAQLADSPPLSIAAFKTPQDPKTGESKFVGYTPTRRAQFIVCVRTQGKDTDPAVVAGRIFRTLTPLKPRKEPPRPARK